MASFIVESNAENFPLPCHFNPDVDTMGAFDNFYHKECTESGIGGSHDTVSILMQENPSKSSRKLNISETNVVHGSKQFHEELPCQKLKEFIKPAKRPDVPEDVVVTDDLF